MRVKTLLACIIAAVLCIGFSMYSQASVSGHKLTVAQIKQKIVKEAKKQGLCPYLALSVCKQESLFRCNAKSCAGAIGLFQLMPATAKDLGVNPYNVDQNIKGGVKYLKMMKRKFGSTRLALAAYNAGPGAVQKYGGVPPYRETRHYVNNIMKFYSQYKKSSDPALAAR